MKEFKTLRKEYKLINISRNSWNPHIEYKFNKRKKIKFNDIIYGGGRTMIYDELPDCSYKRLYIHTNDYGIKDTIYINDFDMNYCGGLQTHDCLIEITNDGFSVGSRIRLLKDIKSFLNYINNFVDIKELRKEKLEKLNTIN